MKTVLITGVSRGIGKALAQKFLEQGWFVIGTSVKGVANLEHKNLAVFQLDLADEKSIEACANKILDYAKKIDIFINNAAALEEADTGPSVDIAALKKTLQINLIGQIDFTQRLFSEIKQGGHILNISSRMGSLNFISNTADPSYRISKAGLNMFTRILAIKAQGEITVSSVHPGSVRTDMGSGAGDMSPEEAAQYIYKLAISKPETGQFWYKGEKFPW